MKTQLCCIMLTLAFSIASSTLASDVNSSKSQPPARKADPNNMNNLQKNAGDALNTFGQKAGMAGDAIVNTVESIGKGAGGPKAAGKSTEPSLSTELNGFAKNASVALDKAGASMRDSSKNLNHSVQNKKAVAVPAPHHKTHK